MQAERSGYERDDAGTRVRIFTGGERIPKKLHSLSGRKAEITRREKVEILLSLRLKYKLDTLLVISQIPRSTYYRLMKEKQDRHEALKVAIKSVFEEHKGRYGYRRITLEIRNKGLLINHKTIQKLMKKLNLKAKVRKVKYNSYEGEVGKIAANILNRDFKASAPDEKWVTDVTQFSVCNKKIYLSPVMDLYNNEIIAYSISPNPSFWQTREMLERAFIARPDAKPVFHSDQGWQYQMRGYQAMLSEHGIIQSMSRKATCLDNACMESFFGRLKQEMFYGRRFRSVDNFVAELENYLHYYNNRRISLKLKGLSPVQYRLQSFQSIN